MSALPEDLCLDFKTTKLNMPSILNIHIVSYLNACTVTVALVIIDTSSLVWNEEGTENLALLTGS
jgi:hypothetical protein